MSTGSSATSLLNEVSLDDPYKYQFGFGNHHVTEAIPGALPHGGSNLPQKGRYGLYAEHLNGTPFISPRDTASNVWMYRERPAAAHRPVGSARGHHKHSHMEACFLPTNPNVTYTPLPFTWGPLIISDLSGQREHITFVDGLKTIGGHGDATLKEGLAVHQYAFDADMHQEAFVNHDGELMLVPQQGVLDIKTELGCLRVKPGMIAVIPTGIRFSVNIIPTPSSTDAAPARMKATGYALEVFGTHYTLPDLGVLGANGLAHPRDFEYPVARPPQPLQKEPQPWTITIKLAGHLHSYTQPHTPFDVIAWHGKYAPFRYDLARFSHLTANTDQLDPTAFCVLTAPSKWSGVSLVDFCVFGEKWAVARDTLRIPYYHRTVATEIGGVIRGVYKGSVRPLEAGGLSLEQSYMPHGETYEAYVRETEAEQMPVKVGEGYLGFMFHIPSHFGLTRWAMEEHPDIRPERPGIWDSMRSHLSDHLDDANSSLTNAGLTSLRQSPAPDTDHGPEESEIPRI